MKTLVPLELTLLKFLKRALSPKLVLGKAHQGARAPAPELCRTSLLLAVSGGMDSMCLLHAVARVTRSKFWPENLLLDVRAIHFNHEQRGTESDADEALVTSTCRQLEIPLFVERFSSVSKDFDDANFQNFAREWRRRRSSELLSLMAEESKTHKKFVATAHHARDNVESIMLHIVRGSGIMGLRGIRQLDTKQSLMRPFAQTSYQDLLEYQRTREILFRIDSSNYHNDYQRNFLRLKILPLMTELNPSYERAFVRLGDNVTEILELMQQKSDQEDSSVLHLSSTTTPGEVIRFATTQNPELSVLMTSHVAQNILAHEFSRLKTQHRPKAQLVLGLSCGWQAVIENNQLRFRRAENTKEGRKN